MVQTPRSRPVLLALLVAAGLLLGLLAAEVLVRGLARVSPRVQALTYLPRVATDFDRLETLPELLARSGMGYHPAGVTPGFFLNSRGFRTHEYADRPAPGTLRMVVLGDSFTFSSSGVPFADMWHSVAGQELAAALAADRPGEAPPVEVISLSAPGVGPRFELRLWELEGRRLAPDLVVLGFFVGNDFIDEAGLEDRPLEAAGSRSHLFRLVRNARLLHRERRRAPAADPQKVEEATAAGEGRTGPGPAAGAVAMERGATPADLAVEPGAGVPAAEPSGPLGVELPSYAATYDPSRPVLSPEAYDDVQWQRLQILLRDPEALRHFQELAEGLRPVLERFVAGVRAAGAEPVFLLIPDESQVDDDLRRRLLADHGLPPDAADVDRPQRWLHGFCAARSVPCVDLLPVFRRHPDQPRLYRPRDTHWTDHGNRLAGRILARTLAEVVGAEPGGNRAETPAKGNPP